MRQQCQGEDVLRNECKLVQKSGRGLNNYRTNLLKAILGELGEEARYTQMLWQYVAVRCLEDEASWSLTQGKFIERMLASNEQVTSCQEKTASFQLCTELDLDPNHYYLCVKKIADAIVAGGDAAAFPDYNSIMNVIGCSKHKSKTLWPAIPVLHNKLLDH